MSSSRKPVNLFLTCLTPGLWDQFYSWYTARATDHKPTVPPGGDGVWVVRQVEQPITVNGVPLLYPDGRPQPELIAGCGIFPCQSTFAVVDFVNTNPSVPPRLRRSAMEIICQGVRQYGAMRGMKMVCHPMHKGIVKMMERFGYLHTRGYGDDGGHLNVVSMYADPWAAAGVFPGEEVWGANGVPAPAATLEGANAAE